MSGRTLTGPIGALALLVTASASGQSWDTVPSVSSALPAMPAHELTVATWGGDYQASQRRVFFDTWEARTGKSINDVAFDGTWRSAKSNLQSGATWDVLDMELADVKRACERGVIRAIDWERIAARDDLVPQAREVCGVGNVIWSYVLAYDSSRVQRKPAGWADLWNFDGFAGKRAVRKTAQWNLEAALIADGVAPEEVYTALNTRQGVERAFAKLEQLKPHVIWWRAGAEPIDLIAAGDAVLATAYNGRVTGAQQAGVTIDLIWAEALYTVDYWVIAANSNNLDDAYSLIDWASTAEIMAYLPAEVAYGPTSRRALDLVRPDLIELLPSTPERLSVGLQSSADFWNDQGPALENLFRLWVEE